MKPILTALSVVLALILSIPAPAIAVNPSKVAKSVTTLNILDASGAYQPICTVSSINEDDNYWLTAAHCVDHPEQTYIFEDPVIIAELDAKYDVAILQTASVSRPALRLGKAPKMGDEIMMVGHQGPLMMNGPTMTRGWIMHPNLITSDRPGWDMPFMVFQMVGAPGNSGSAVVNKKDQIVSVLQWGFGRSFSEVSGGATYDKVARHKKYFE